MYQTVELTLPAKKTIALIAHDNKKTVMLNWVKANRDALARHQLCGTGTTARIIADETLDSKLEEQRGWFVENASLSVL